MSYPVVADCRADPPVTVIIPYKPGDRFNPIHVCRNDEVLVVTGGRSIGEARIAGAKAARNRWLIFMDADAVYPPEYIPNIKSWIRILKYPIMAATRRGGYGNIFTKVYEHGLIVRRDVFLMRTRNYSESWWRGRGTDVSGYFGDAIRIPVVYYHSFTGWEKTATCFLIGFSLLGASIVIHRLTGRS